MTPDAANPEQTLTMPVVPEADTETMEALPEPVTEPVPSQAPEPVTVTYSAFPWFPIGDALISSVPGFDTMPCGHCKAVFTGAVPDVLTETRPLEILRHLAYEAGWRYDLSLIWTCPECQAAALAVRAEGNALLAGGSYPSILREFDIEARTTMTAGGRHPWDYDAWREKYRPRPERCIPESEAAAEGQAAA